MLIYNSRSTGTSVLNVFLIKLSKIQYIEIIASSNTNKMKQYKKMDLREKEVGRW